MLYSIYVISYQFLFVLANVDICSYIELKLFTLHQKSQKSQFYGDTACVEYIFKELHLSFSGKTNEKRRTRLGKQFAGKTDEKQVERQSQPQGSNSCQSNACTHPR